MKYKSVVITKKGSPEVLKVVESEFRAPRSGETRIKVLATEDATQTRAIGQLVNDPQDPVCARIRNYWRR